MRTNDNSQKGRKPATRKIVGIGGKVTKKIQRGNLTTGGTSTVTKSVRRGKIMK